MTIDYELGQEFYFHAGCGLVRKLTVSRIVIEKDGIYLQGEAGACRASEAKASPDEIFDLMEIQAKQDHEDRMKYISEKREQFKKEQEVRE